MWHQHNPQTPNILPRRDCAPGYCLGLKRSHEFHRSFMNVRKDKSVLMHFYQVTNMLKFQETVRFYYMDKPILMMSFISFQNTKCNLNKVWEYMYTNEARQLFIVQFHINHVYKFKHLQVYRLFVLK